MAKYRTTGCFKFLIFILIAVPAALAISSYYHGENPIDFVKEKLGQTTTADSGVATSDTGSTKASTNNAQISDLNAEINELRNQVRGLESENQNLRNVIKEKDKEITRLSDGY